METSLLAPPAAFFWTPIALRTTRPREFIDITDTVAGEVAASGVENGLALVSSRHTTASIVVNEHEPELLKDLDRLLAEMAPEDRGYLHNGVPCGHGEQPNGHSHCQALFLSTSATLPIVAGRLGLGRYQRIFLVELDGARDREVLVSVLGS